jgi:hypothetical protein
MIFKRKYEQAIRFIHSEFLIPRFKEFCFKERVEKKQKKGKMKWIKMVREDGRIEYLCEHGVGHGNHIHGCDGCCSRKDYPRAVK